MRTLALLAAILLLALQAQAQPLPEFADQAQPFPEKAEEALAEQQPQQEDQDMATTFEEAESSGPQDAGQAERRICICGKRFCICKS